MPKFNITTLGCKVNQYESEAISTYLKESGWEQTTGGDAEVCIINTCTVTGKASMQSRQAIRQIIRANPGARIIVTGCYAQTEAEEIKATIEGVHEIVGQGDKHRIPEAVLNLEKQPPYPAVPRSNACEETVFRHLPVTVYGSRTRPFLKIQDGCNAFCTYCIVPYARGRSRSMPVEDVMQNLRQLVKAGYHEAVLTGIHVGCYGLDLTPETNLAELLKRILTERVIDRLRLSSIEPRELTDEMIEMVAASDRFCRHFHIPLQSGDDQILKRMHRPYDRQLFRERIMAIHEHLPDAAIGVDTLIGFPGETEAAFENTHALIEELPVTYLHVFPFSPRQETPAAGYPDHVAPDVLKERCSRMRELGRRKKSAFYKAQLGKMAEVLIEDKRNGATGLLKGITSNYLNVLLKGGDDLKNRLVSVRLWEMHRSGAILGSVGD